MDAKLCGIQLFSHVLVVSCQKNEGGKKKFKRSFDPCPIPETNLICYVMRKLGEQTVHNKENISMHLSVQVASFLIHRASSNYSPIRG